MGVCIWRCNKDQENIIKEVSIDCYKKTDQSLFPNVITSNNIVNEDNQKMIKIKYNKLFNDGKEQPKLNQHMHNNNQNIYYTYSNNANSSNSTENEKYIKYVVKIQSFYRKHIRRKREKNKNKIEVIKNNKEDSLLLKLNLEMTETVFSSNSFNNSNISKDNENNNGGYKIIENDSDNESYKEECNINIPFNIKNKITNMHYKYSGYVKKKTKILSESPKIKNYNSNTCEEKEIFDNEDKSGLIKEGFGKLIFTDGTEFCGSFHNNVHQNYGKYSSINQKNKNNLNKEDDKEILITDNVNYEDFIGLYKNYVPDGFGIYNNFITNLKITGIFGNRGIHGIGIEQSEEGGYTYEGEFNNNKKEGVGTILWKDGCKYLGEFQNNQMHGYGIIEFNGNNFYKGQIKNGKMEGFGEFIWSDKRRYIGHYKNDKRNGFGIYMSKASDTQNIGESENEYEIYNSSIFVGFWKNGNMEGFGMKIINSDIKYGIWENGFKKKYIEGNLASKTYGKSIDSKYKKIFFAEKQSLMYFLEIIFNNNSNV